jgi:hypothetical protein
MFLIFAMIITLAVVVFFPNIEFLAKDCPPLLNTGFTPVAVYQFPTLNSQWAVFISCFQVAATGGLLIYDIVRCNSTTEAAVSLHRLV